MSQYLQIALFIASLLTFIFVISCSKKHKMNIRYAIVWTLWSLGIIFISLYPQIVDYISNILNIAVPVNTLFLIMIFLLYLLSFYLFLKISLLNEQIKNIAYEIALIKKELGEKNE
ncbi:DUF2304 domain-containing protein [Holdemania massiliensis]|uniref:DUF2304 domain-containing protein n=1 Tax=Holdemania massiliensis TaxID=1468449 RepID=UPI001F053C14|nr:DUF2304 domain-containing protein [Holdemania massiliensis]MCH1940223.1 DUF2304 domain-containing protein [Holdemania massiliensis]